jgi:hypothetical protein
VTKRREQTSREMQLVCDGENIFLVFDGKKIARRKNRQWTSLEPGYRVTMSGDYNSIEVEFTATDARPQ